MTIEELLGILDELAPRTEQLGWDNSGLLIGHRDREVRKIYLAVDATEEVIRHAREFGADVLLTHHPLIFTKLSRVSDEDFVGRRVLELAEAGIALIAMHTNFDIHGMREAIDTKLGLHATGMVGDEAGPGDALAGSAGTCDALAGSAGTCDALTGSTGTCDALAGSAGTCDASVGSAGACGTSADSTGTCGVEVLDDEDRIGSIAELRKAVRLDDYAKFVRDAFGLEGVRVFGDGTTSIRRVAVCGGSGKSEIETAIRKGADLLVTGDIDHHSGLDALEQGLCIIDAGHYGLEHVFMDYMRAYLKENAPGIASEMEPMKEAFRIV